MVHSEGSVKLGCPNIPILILRQKPVEKVSGCSQASRTLLSGLIAVKRLASIHRGPPWPNQARHKFAHDLQSLGTPKAHLAGQARGIMLPNYLIFAQRHLSQ